jgi:hypothetical protein
MSIRSSTDIKVGNVYKGPNWEAWDDYVTVATIENVSFTIEDSDIDEVSVVFRDTEGKLHTVTTEWSDGTQTHSVVAT